MAFGSGATVEPYGDAGLQAHGALAAGLARQIAGGEAPSATEAAALALRVLEHVTRLSGLATAVLGAGEREWVSAVRALVDATLGTATPTTAEAVSDDTASCRPSVT